MLRREQTFITCLVTQSSVAKQETQLPDPSSSAPDCQDRVSSTSFPDVLSLPHSSYCQNGRGKEVENRANVVALKAAE